MRYLLKHLTLSRSLLVTSGLGLFWTAVACGGSSPTSLAAPGSPVPVASLTFPSSTALYFSGFEQGFPSSEWTGTFGETNYSADGVTPPDIPDDIPAAGALWSIVSEGTDTSGNIVRPRTGSWMYKGLIYDNPNDKNNGGWPLIHADELLDSTEGFAMPLVNRFYVYADWDESRAQATDWMHFATWSNVYENGWQPVTLSAKGNRRMEMGHIEFDFFGNPNDNKFPLQQWVRFTVYMDYSLPDGYYLVWMNGIPIMEGSGRRAAIPGDTLLRAHWGIYTNPTFPTGGVQYNDDIQIWSLDGPWPDKLIEPPSPYEN